MHGRQYREWQRDRAEHQAEERRRLEAKVEHEPETRRQARDHFAELDIPGTPDLRPARVLKIMGIPEWCGSRQVHNVLIERGDPMDGLKRSDDHIGYFKIEVPLSEISWSDVRGRAEEYFSDREYLDVCPECGCERVIYTYSANHYITGFERVMCPGCDQVYALEEWG